ncbi:MAG: YqeG family HAD IIIA-type phosphatase [Traorella sp.]
MIINLYPDEIKQKLVDIDLNILYEQKISILILDVDNTLCLHDEESISQEKLMWIQKALDLGMKIILISNNHASRIERIAKKIGCQFCAFSLKPLPFVYMKIIKQNLVDKNCMMCIGDQLFTDILGAKLMGLKNIYVKPMSEKDIIYTRIPRKIEKWILKEKI